MLGSIAAQVRSEHAQTGRRPLGQVRIQVRRHVPWSGSAVSSSPRHEPRTNELTRQKIQRRVIAGSLRRLGRGRGFACLECQCQ